MRVTDQYFWNVVFTLFFITLVVMGAIILESDAYKPLVEATLLDLLLITLASWRLTRLVVYDTVLKFFREQFWDVKEVKGIKGGYVLEKPAGGPRRTLADLLSCPWCFGLWAAAMVTFFYFLTPWALFPTLFLAIAAVASFLQILSNLVGHKSERLKSQKEAEF